MRKLSTFCLTLLISLSMFAQDANRIVSIERAKEVHSYKPLDLTKLEASQNVARTQPGSSIVPEFHSDAVTSQLIGEASNAYTFIIGENHQIVTKPGVGTNGGTLAFIHRQNIAKWGGVTADNGRLRYGISDDGGQTWGVENGTINPTYAYPNGDEARGRYPNCALYMPSGGTQASDLELIYACPALDPNGWNGHVVGRVSSLFNPNSSPPPPYDPSVDQEDYLFTNGGTDGVLFPYDLWERVDGEFWYVSFPYDQVAGATDVTRIKVYKGEHDGTMVNWALASTINLPTETSIDGASHITSLNLAFSPDGQTGYISFLGDLVGGQTGVYSPCFVESKDGGDNWLAPVEFDMGTCRELFDSLTFFQFIDTVTGDTLPVGTGLATTGFDSDLTVDGNGDPHLIATVGNGTTTNGDPPGYSVFSGVILITYDFTKDEFGDWNMMHLGSQSTFRGDFADLTADPWVQVGRSPDGNIVAFSWTDTDTTLAGNPGWEAGNSDPDLRGCAYNITTRMMTPVVDWTAGDQVWDGAALMPKIAPVILEPNAGEYLVPTVVMSLDGATDLDPVSFHYFSDIMYVDADFTEMPQFCFTCKSTPYANSTSVTDANCGSSDGEASIALGGGTAPYSVMWSNGAMTDTVMGLDVGIYTVTVTDANGCEDEQSVTINNIGAATLAIDTSSDPKCAGEETGEAQVTVTGGTAPFTYMWSNGTSTSDTADDLPSGTTTVTVTDDNNCASVVSVTLMDPDAIDASAASVDVLCNGGDDGSIDVSASGGTGTLSYSWDDGATGATRSDLMAGTYDVTISDDNDCEVMLSVTINEPAELSVSGSSTANTATQAPFTGTASVSVVGGTGPYTYAWDNNQTSSFIFGLEGGVYSCTVTDANGCTETIEVTVDDNSVGIEEDLAGINEIALFPNPTNGTFSLAIELVSADDINIAVTNLNGQTVMQSSKAAVLNLEASFDASDLPAGIYMVRVSTSKGAVYRKLIVE